MTKILNQYSYLILGALILALAVYALSRRGFRKVDWLLLIVLVGLIFAAWWVMHPTASQVEDADAVRAKIGAGTPVLLEFQSPY
jgi:ABC-type glycerol-3-phosphate transport system permease component